jgi:hypothetical protein
MEYIETAIFWLRKLILDIFKFVLIRFSDFYKTAKSELVFKDDFNEFSNDDLIFLKQILVFYF